MNNGVGKSGGFGQAAPQPYVPSVGLPGLGGVLGGGGGGGGGAPLSPKANRRPQENYGQLELATPNFF